jgi:D-glycero-D-manno-heptose 1,7-bisphosphate phosphatase
VKRTEPLFLAGSAGRADLDRSGDRSTRPGLLCDRDGTVIENRDGYVLEPADVVPLNGAARALQRADAYGFTVVLVSNQSAIGRGLLTPQVAMDLHGLALARLPGAESVVAGSYLCPHRPADRCSCRKPAADMVLAALSRFRLDPARTFLVGDAWEDMTAARIGGVSGLLVLTGRGRTHAPKVTADPGLNEVEVLPDVGAAVEYAGRRLAAGGPG